MSKLFRKIPLLVSLLVSLLFSGCASKFPTPINASPSQPLAATGPNIFTETLTAHGGDKLDDLQNVSVGITGEWKQLIRRIQPKVTDYKYRVDSQERLFPKERVYAAQYTGPSGHKSVFRSPSKIQVHYNNDEALDAQTLSSTALTADAFHLFLLGPLSLAHWQDQFQRLNDKKLNGKLHQRIYLARQPGFGFGAADQVVLWVDPQTKLTRMIQITLTGHESTKVAHVEVEYMEYRSVSHYTFPSKFFERVNAPIAIDAHAWQLTGLTINSEYSIEDLMTPGFTGAAQVDVAFD